MRFVQCHSLSDAAILTNLYLLQREIWCSFELGLTSFRIGTAIREGISIVIAMGTLSTSLSRSLSRSLFSLLISVDLVSSLLHFQENTVVINDNEFALSYQKIVAYPLRGRMSSFISRFYHRTSKEV